MTDLKIIKPGPLTLIQDCGRRQHQHMGLSQGGAIDQHAYFWSNYLLQNANNAAALEITLGPFEAEFEAETLIAICGADLQCRINDVPVQNWCSHKIKSGDRLQMFPGNNGLRSYLSIKGGLHTPLKFNSRSEIPREKFAFTKITADTTIPYTRFNPDTARITATPDRFIAHYNETLTLRVLPSYQYKFFSKESRQSFSSHTYTITPSSDRMGYRLAGEKIPWEAGNIISEGIALGSVQLPPDGQPIVLLRDRQTIGGYPKIGCVCQKDCAQLAQRRAGQQVNFEFVDFNTLSSSTVKVNPLHPLYY